MISITHHLDHRHPRGTGGPNHRPPEEGKLCPQNPPTKPLETSELCKERNLQPPAPLSHFHATDPGTTTPFSELLYLIIYVSRPDLSICGPDLRTCGPDLRTCGPDLRTCGPDGKSRDKNRRQREIEIRESKKIV
jgi:hypothetical protein